MSQMPHCTISTSGHAQQRDMSIPRALSANWDISVFHYKGEDWRCYGDGYQ
jgi:hypothetical protein